MSSATEEQILAGQKVPPPGPVSFEEFLEWCDDETHAEWVDGEIMMAPPPNTEHQMIRDFLVKILGVYVEARELGAVISAPYLMRLPSRPSGREPDLLFVSKERANLMTHQLLNGPADLVVEIVSPESIGRDRGDKFVEYEAAGVREYWLIDPLREQAEFYQLGADGRYRLGPVGTDGIYRSLVLDGFWLRVAWFWQNPLPPVLSLLKELGVI
ncbi:MAG TPA: Uma2 family endonuclease [Roseiflexaceae bacterium]|jgi:Uma2 family endonuclease